MFFSDDSLFGSIHAAHCRAVFVAFFIPGPHTLEEGNFSRYFPVRRSGHMACKRTGSTEDSFKLGGGDHIFKSTISIFFFHIRFKFIESRSQDDGAHGNGFSCLFLVIFDSIGLADILTETATDAFLPINSIYERNSLRIIYKNSSPHGEPAVILVGSLHRTVLGTETTTRTFLMINISGTDPQFHSEITRFTIHIHDVCIGEQLNVVMSSCRYQFWGHDTHGTV